MLEFTVDCGDEVKLHFNAANAKCRFRLFDLPSGETLGTSPDNNGAWTYSFGVGEAGGGQSLKLETTLIGMVAGDQPIRVRVEDSTGDDKDPDDTDGEDHSNRGWKLGDATNGQADEFYVNLFCG